MHSNDYKTCEKTYATLRIYPGDMIPAEVTLRFGLAPSQTQQRGELRGCGQIIRLNSWFLSSKDTVTSTDLREHLDWILDQIVDKADVLDELRAKGAKVDIACYWSCIDEHGGPTLFPSQMEKLAKLKLECWFDIYFPTEGEAVNVFR